LRVAHFIQRYPPALGGSEAYFARLGDYLARQGDRVEVFTTTAIDLQAFWSRRGRCLDAGVDTEGGVIVRRYALCRWPGRRYALKALSLLPHRLWQCLTLPCNPIAPAMWRDAGRLQPVFDLVHVSAFPYAWPMACGLRLARRQGIPFLVTPFLHLGDPDDPADRTRRAYLSPALSFLLKAAEVIFVQTELEQAALVKRGFAPERIVRIGMGVAASECTGGDGQRARRQWQLAGDGVIVGHLANHSAEKGTIDLLKAADQCWRQGAQFRIVLAGPSMPSFERFWRNFPFQDRVRRLGVLSEQQKRDFFAGLDLFALPSRSDSFGLVLLEAWANGIPNLAYRAGGVAEVIQHGHDGWLVGCGDVQQLAVALKHLTEDRVLRCRLGQAGLERTTTEFRWEDKLARVREVYLQVCAKKQAGKLSPACFNNP
jgi:glycosyltransferase involved in cell wall biosynthesis